MNIKKAAELVGLSADTIRYYERIGLVPAIPRTTSGIRDFQQTDLDALAFVKCFRAAGVSVESLIEYMALYQEGDKTRQARLEILQEEHQKMQERYDELGQALDRLNLKIQHYQSPTFETEIKDR
ncbi:stress response transcriptional regulator NmlR [Streptococcus halotolerans]|uniref:stress response transcriptional regulator NmlR n=1 Tax=Streptococcus halotolerans TaxID=1814128 RepID=UPI0007898F0D|nr:stress response transcriptional regulator NmlR [Streptococcus halotolerans]